MNYRGAKMNNEQYLVSEEELLKWFLHWGTGASSMSFEDVVHTFFDDKTPVSTLSEEKIRKITLKLVEHIAKYESPEEVKSVNEKLRWANNQLSNLIPEGEIIAEGVFDLEVSGEVYIPEKYRDGGRYNLIIHKCKEEK